MRTLLPILLLAASSAALAGLDARQDPPVWQVDGTEGAPLPSWIHVGDIDGDGKDDLLVADPTVAPATVDPTRVLVFLGGHLSPTPDQVFDGASEVATWATGALGDLNGDGKDDWVSWTGNEAVSRQLWVRWGTAGGLSDTAEALTLVDPYNPTGFGKRVPEGPLRDVNADGRADVLVRAVGGRDRAGQVVYALHRGTDTGIEADAQWRRAVDWEGLVDSHGRIVGDVDADGLYEAAFLDVLPAGDGDGLQVQLSLVRGRDGGLADFTWAAVGVPDKIDDADDVRLLDLGDIDGDGRDDVGVSVRGRPGEPSLLLAWYGDTLYGLRDAAAEVLYMDVAGGDLFAFGTPDVDGDGSPDIVIGRPDHPVAGASGAVEIALGANGRFRVGTDLRFTPSLDEHGFGYAGAVGDFDADGRQDLVVAVRGAPGDASRPSSLQLFLGYRDRDGDRWDDDEDCRPGNPDVHPGAEEIWYDGVDQDCDGNDRDQDVDGVNLDLDCDDTDPTVHPFTTEIWYDGVDQDCDDVDDDQDGDGFAASVVGGDDCDDLDRTVNPGAKEVAGNGIDDDCQDGDAALPDATPDGAGPGCACSAAPSPRALTPLLALLVAGLTRRRPGCV